MIQKDKLSNFDKMWTWLYEHPAHDQEYYMEYVAKLDESWENSCPLSNDSTLDNCDGCNMLWKSNKGSLCMDPESPLIKWKNTERQEADKRSYYADQVAVLTEKFIHTTEH